MPIEYIAQQIMVALVVLAVVVGLVVLNRKLVVTRAPVVGTILSVAVACTALALSASVMGMRVSQGPWWLLAGAFAGIIGSQPQPWSPSSVLRGLSLACGMLALYSALLDQLLEAVIGVFATGLLFWLSSNPESSGDRGGGASQ